MLISCYTPASACHTACKLCARWFPSISPHQCKQYELCAQYLSADGTLQLPPHAGAQPWCLQVQPGGRQRLHALGTAPTCRNFQGKLLRIVHVGDMHESAALCPKHCSEADSQCCRSALAHPCQLRTSTASRHACPQYQLALATGR